jgi:hypothetical protein
VLTGGGGGGGRGKLDEVVSEGFPPEQERRCDSKEDWQWLELTAKAKEGTRERGGEGRGGPGMPGGLYRRPGGTGYG